MTAGLIINAAITGCVFTKADTPYLPVTIEEITGCAREVSEAGAAIVHLHARNPDQSPCYDGGLYRELLASVRAACPDLILCVSLSGRHTQDVAMRLAPLQGQPDMTSLTLGSTNFAREPNVNPPDAIRSQAARIYEAGALPELEVFEAGFAHFARHLADKGVLRPPHYANLFLGSLGSAPLDLIGLGHMVSLLPEGTIWATAGLGRYQLDANVMAIAAGGHARTGLEDNLHVDRERRMLADNVRLVSRVTAIGRAVGREPMLPAEVRQLLGLPQRGPRAAV